MKLLSIATEERRPGICPVCMQAIEYAKFLARGCYGGARDRAGGVRTASVRGVFWSPAPHDCKPVARLEPVAVEPPAGERGS